MPKQDDTRDLLLKSQYRKWLAEHPPESKPFEEEPSETGDILDLVNDADRKNQMKQCNYCKKYFERVVRVDEFIACPACARKIFEKQKASK